MKTYLSWLAAVAAAVLLGALALGEDARRPAASAQPELEYLKIVNRAAPPRDPEVLFLLMSQFANAGRQREGAEFFSSVEQEFAPRLSDTQKAIYLSATALLRAQAAQEISLLNRIGWVKDSLAMLDQAVELSRGEVFVVRWISGVVRAQVPAFFAQRGRAHQDLQWCLEHADRAPHPGWLGEVRDQLAALRDGKAAEKPITLVTPFSEDPAAGHSFSARRIDEVVPGRVYTLSGFEFTEYYFIVSDDGRELIGIDAGTRPDAAQAAYEALHAAFPKLPPLSTVLFTHAHWDHIGGHRYFRSLEPKPRFIARSNYAEEIDIDLKAPRAILKQFFGERFDIEELRSFKPDATVERQTQLKIGGTRVELIPVDGGETHDGLFISLPDLGVLFVGDFIMPYLGAPFVEEGDFEGLLRAIDVVAEKNPRHLLHGHQPLTRIFNSASMLVAMKGHLGWLRDQVRAGIRDGAERAALQQANLIPPQLLGSDPATHVAYLVMRENVINRLYDQNVGYWQPGLRGVDYLSRADRGSALVDYLGVSERQLAAAAQKMIQDGKHELAADLIGAARERFPESAALAQVEHLAYLKLEEKYQNMNPFKFILYSARAGDSAARPGPGLRPGEAAAR
jgi:glyoxylase-like metal-dependent hydrolase (beta-lactamase superfamily II)